MELLPTFLQLAVAETGGAEAVDGMARLLELRGDDFIRLQRGNGEGDHRGRHVLIQEGAGHGVLAADGGGSQSQLGIQGAQKGLEGLAPARRLVSQLLEELL